jgi:hypothetical protein
MSDQNYIQEESEGVIIALISSNYSISSHAVPNRKDKSCLFCGMGVKLGLCPEIMT